MVPTPVGRGAPAAPLTVTAAPAPAGSNIDAYDAAVQHAFAQVQAAVAASADLKAVPSNLDPPLADAAAELNDAVASTAACALFSKSDSLSARRAIPPRRRRWPWSATRMPRCGIRRSSRSPTQRHWRLEMLAKAACPLLDLPITNPLSFAGSTPSASSGAVRSSPGCAPSTRGWSW